MKFSLNFLSLKFMIGLNIEIDVGGMIGTYHNCIADMEYSLKKKTNKKKQASSIVSI